MIKNNCGQPVNISIIPVLILLIIVSVFVSSCGKGDTGGNASTKNESNVKLPPGTTEEALKNASYTSVSGNGEEADGRERQEETVDESEDGTTAQTPRSSVDLAGGRFTVVEASRKDTNKDAIQTGQREVSGDYLEIELEVQNVGDDLIDLTQYSFRLESPGIDADSYYDYYGQVNTYGKYVTGDTISGVLMDYSDLQAADYVLKMGETVDKLFLFYDLNPQNVANNDQMTKDNTKLIIYKSSGSDYGEKVEVGLAGYPD